MVNEAYVEHSSYDPSCSLSKLRSTMIGKSTTKSENKTRPKTSNTFKNNGWATAQAKEYHDKAALLNEINYTKPLVEKYGDHYFEFILRNRFEDDLKPPPYIYLVSDKKFSDTRAISKIKRNSFFLLRIST
jgi:hypothetical protein